LEIRNWKRGFQPTLLDIFQISVVLYCRTLFGEGAERGSAVHFSTRLKNVQ